MSFVIVSVSISAVWIVGFAIYLLLSHQLNDIEQETIALSQQLERQKQREK